MNVWRMVKINQSLQNLLSKSFQFYFHNFSRDNQARRVIKTRTKTNTRTRTQYAEVGNPPKEHKEGKILQAMQDSGAK